MLIRDVQEVETNFHFAAHSAACMNLYFSVLILLYYSIS